MHCIFYCECLHVEDICESSGVILALVFIVFACVVASVVAAVLSHLVVKAADLQEQSDLTI